MLFIRLFKMIANSTFVCYNFYGRPNGRSEEEENYT